MNPIPASISPAEQAARLRERDAKHASLLEARRKLSLAFAEVFGVDGSRTERQTAVMKNLRMVCCIDTTTAEPMPDGRVDPSQVLVLEGRRQIGIHVSNMIADAALPPPA